ncbi:hypothetical protein K457DRAFT_211377 [Linnemannia elongata AG-77]|uniref:Uncharacterized protein n=1 Tax=Linnemannia elongata AG-77 TaxID=1314771 RepID=A0A197K707_9FUNG|nr:hypothetical protein K457DRAFT_211377 [Linnemannia elongata AG-77]
MSINVLRLRCVCVALRCLFICLIAVCVHLSHSAFVAYFCQTKSAQIDERKRSAIEWD